MFLFYLKKFINPEYILTKKFKHIKARITRASNIYQTSSYAPQMRSFYNQLKGQSPLEALGKGSYKRAVRYQQQRLLQRYTRWWQQSNLTVVRAVMFSESILQLAPKLRADDVMVQVIFKVEPSIAAIKALTTTALLLSLATGLA